MEEYSVLSSDSKLMYGLLLDRLSLSKKNGWLDDDGEVFAYYTVEELVGDLRFGREKIMRLFKNLERAGLITRRKSGVGKPSRIYIKTVPDGVSKSDTEMSENDTCTGLKTEFPKVGKPDCNNKYFNKIDMNHPNSTSYYDDLVTEIREQIEYEYLCDAYGQDKDIIDSVVSVICDTLCDVSETVKLGGGTYPKSLVDSRLRSLNEEHISYMLNTIAEVDREIVNMRLYLLTLMFNAPTTIESYYSVKVRTDMYNCE